MSSSSTRPRPDANIPTEAKPYCDHRGFIIWAKVAPIICDRLNLDLKTVWVYELSKILKGEVEDRFGGALAIMRELKLDQVVSSVMLDPRSGSRRESNAKAIRYAEDFGIQLDQVVGTGPDGLILKRDVVAHHRGLKIGWVNAVVSDNRLLRQRRTLANHLHATLSALRSTRQELADALDHLAATAEALGEEKTERILEHVARITLSENLKKEQETNARLDAVVRRLSARPRIKRGTTHVEIGGIVFRNRTSKRRSLA